MLVTGAAGCTAGALVRPLTGLKLAPYYGCLLTRPPDITHFDDPEDPQTLDNLLRADRRRGGALAG